MSDVFIAYARSDVGRAQRVAQRLRAEGWSVFLDVNTPVGKSWHRTIEKELHAARAVVVLWSATSRDSDFVLEEAGYGKRKGVLFPALIEAVECPYGFGLIQTADLVNWDGDAKHRGLADLLEPLRLWLNGQAAKPKDGAHAEPVLIDPARRPVRSRPMAAPSGRTFRDTLASGGEGPLMVEIPAGRFIMGSPSEEPKRLKSEGPQHEVRIAQPFAMGVYAVTFDEYDRYADDTGDAKPNDEGWGRGKRPVINVSWHDVQAYCVWLRQQTGQSYRLPSEAQWEYACRGGTTTPFHFGERLGTDQANFDGNFTYNGSTKGEYRKKTVPVGSFAPNAFGLYDMHGNVWEWCQDGWHDAYEGAPGDGSARESEVNRSRVLRGGSWNLNPESCRSARRNLCVPEFRYNRLGFRVCRGSPIDLPDADTRDR